MNSYVLAYRSPCPGQRLEPPWVLADRSARHWANNICGGIQGKRIFWGWGQILWRRRTTEWWRTWCRWCYHAYRKM